MEQESKKKLMRLEKQGLIDKYFELKRAHMHVKNKSTAKDGQIRHFRIRLLKIRNDIDYLLTHPWGWNTGTRSRRK